MNRRFKSVNLLIFILAFVVLKGQSQEINNLVLSQSYPTVGLDSELRASVSGKRSAPPLIIIPGWGLSADSYKDLVTQCNKKYQIHIIHVPGYRNTPSYPIPGTSYGNQIWTNAVVGAISRYIDRNHLKRPLIFGNLNTSTQIAIRLGLRHADKIGGIVVACGPTALNLPNMPIGVDVAKRAQAQDSIYSQRWFKTLTRETWNNGNYSSMFYSMDSVKGNKLWNAVADNELPVMIQYLEEFNAQDTEIEAEQLTIKTIVLLPKFDNAPSTSPMFEMVKRSFIEPWTRLAEKNGNIKTEYVSSSHAFVASDRPDAIVKSLLRLSADF